MLRTSHVFKFILLIAPPVQKQIKTTCLICEIFTFSVRLHYQPPTPTQSKKKKEASSFMLIFCCLSIHFSSAYSKFMKAFPFAVPNTLCLCVWQLFPGNTVCFRFVRSQQKTKKNCWHKALMALLTATVNRTKRNSGNVCKKTAQCHPHCLIGRWFVESAVQECSTVAASLQRWRQMFKINYSTDSSDRFLLFRYHAFFFSCGNFLKVVKLTWRNVKCWVLMRKYESNWLVLAVKVWISVWIKIVNDFVFLKKKWTFKKYLPFLPQ